MLSSRAAAFSVKALLTSTAAEGSPHLPHADPPHSPHGPCLSTPPHRPTSAFPHSQPLSCSPPPPSPPDAVSTPRPQPQPSSPPHCEPHVNSPPSPLCSPRPPPSPPHTPGNGSPPHVSPTTKADDDDDLVVDVEECSSDASCNTDAGKGRPHSPGSAPPAGQQLGWPGGGATGIRLHLLQRDLWTKFHSLTTEMIITKNGRRMFPVVKVGLEGLAPDRTYMVYLDLAPLDTRRYRYVYPSSRWMVAGTGEPLGEQPPYIHPDSPATGVQWMAVPALAFDRLKLTNNKSREGSGQIVLHSMQKYVPRVWVQEVGAEAGWADLPRLVDPAKAYVASFPETAFITVTAYQNQQITRLKIDSNPFAKGFRDTSKQKECVERGGLCLPCPPEVDSATTLLPLGMANPPHLPLPSPHHLPNFPPPFSLGGAVSPPVSPLLMPPPCWTPTLPFLLPALLPALHSYPPTALDLSKPKHGDT